MAAAAPDQIIRKLAEGNKMLGVGQELAEVCRHLDPQPARNRSRSPAD
jgi:hypothetical protein